MEIDILDSLEDLGYTGPLNDKGALRDAIKLGAKSVEFTELVSYLSKELQALCELEGFINPIDDAEDSSSFVLEVSSFLKELNCPYECLLDGAISQRLVETKNKVLLLDFLCSELQAAHVIHAKSEKQKSSLDIELDSSSTATSLSSIAHTLNLDLEHLDGPDAIFDTINDKVLSLLGTHPNLVPPPILKEKLTDEQWSALEKLQQDMSVEYKLRRDMLLTRLDVTIQSFKWGENSKHKENEIAKAFQARRLKMKSDPAVHISDALSSREDIVIVEKTSSKAVLKNTKSAVYRVLIPDVPDRGGRPKEQRPPVEMPGWQNRSQGRGGRGDGGFRGGGGRGGGGRGGNFYSKRGGGGGKRW